MEDMNHFLPPYTSQQLSVLRVRVGELEYGDQESCFAIALGFFIGGGRGCGDVNDSLFEGDSALGGKLKEGLKFRVDYLVINEQLLEQVQRRYVCARVQVGRSTKHSKRWTIYKKRVAFCLIQQSQIINFEVDKPVVSQHIDSFVYYNTEDIRSAILKKLDLPHYYCGKFWIFPQKLPENYRDLRVKINNDRCIIPFDMLNNDPQVYKLQRKFKEFAILIEKETQKVLADPERKCYHHPNELAKYMCICLNERSFACDQKCIESSSKHKRRCIYVPRSNLFLEEKEKEMERKREKELGLFNEQNMCFFNTIVQCLAHIKRLSIYFLKYKEKDELNYWNCDGTHGQVALQYGRFIRQHWQGKNEKCNMPLFEVVGRWNPTYANKHQQDSHQFLIKMLDWLKEDLNLNEHKPSYKYIETANKNEVELAEESEQILRARNFSIIELLMEGLQKSVISCITCGSSSSTFDSFMTVQLPMSSQRKIQILKNSCSAFLVSYMNEKKIKKLQLYYDKETTISDLKKYVRSFEKTDTEIDFYRVGTKGKVELLNNMNIFDLLSLENKDEVIFCVEKYKIGQRSDTVEVKLVFQNEETLPFSRPIYILKEIEVQQLYVKILSYIFLCVNEQYYSVQTFFNKYFQSDTFPFDLAIRKQDGQETPVKRVKSYDRFYLEHHCFLVVKIRKNKDFSFAKLNTYSTINNVHDPKKKMMFIEPSIEDCLKMYCKKEMIGGKWQCPKCQAKRDAAKTLFFHRLPTILILSLNRFKEIYSPSSINSQFQKNENLIKFNTTLNMGKFTESQVDQEYRLTAVACHIRLSDCLRDVQQMNGHYYAHIRTKQGWLRFDDTQVVEISEDRVLNDKSAYILFYEKA